MIDIFDLFADLPRQTPGSDACTRAALALVSPTLPHGRTIMAADMGCGTGRASLVLAHDLDCQVAAFDIRQPALDRLAENARRLGLEHRLHPARADMGAPPLAPASLDLIWCEGAIFVLGAARAATLWRPLLRPGGWLVFSDMVWSQGQRDAPVVDYLAGRGITLPTRQDLETAMAAAGLVPRHTLTLPDEAWWDEYYTPLTALLETCPPSAMVDMLAQEIELRWSYPHSTDYVFVLAQREG